jgi:hypothetical protein
VGIRGTLESRFLTFWFTQAQGFYNNVPFFVDGLGTDVYSGQGDLGILYSDVSNGGRLPDYHRLDISLKRMLSFPNALPWR